MTITLLIEDVDISHYKAADRKIRHVFNGAIRELLAMVINFAHTRDLGVPGDHSRKGWDRRAACAEYAAERRLRGATLRALARHDRREGEVQDIPPHRSV